MIRSWRNSFKCIRNDSEKIKLVATEALATIGLTISNKIKDYVKTSLGKAIVLDQSINRPAHAVRDFGAALNDFFKKNPSVSEDPNSWKNNHSNYEAIIIDYYGKHRPGMTDPLARFNKSKNLIAKIEGNKKWENLLLYFFFIW